MFFSKLRKRNSFLSHIIDLIIVFIGVYSASLIADYNQNIQDRKEREKVLSAIKGELEQFRLFNERWASYMESTVRRLDSLYDKEIYTSEFNTWRYLEPQYNYRIIEYATNLKGTNVIDIELFIELQRIYNDIRKLEHAERFMTHFSNLRDMSGDDTKNLQNRFYLFKFIFYSRDRINILRRLQKTSEEVLELVNDRLSPKIKHTVELELAQKVIDFMGYETVPILKKHFPDITDQEWEEMKRLLQTQEN